MTDSNLQRKNAVQAFEQHDWPGLRQLAPSLLPAFPNDACVHYMSGTAFLEAGDLRQALPLLSRAVTLDDDNAQYATQLARAWSTAQQTNPALEAARKAVTLKPQSAGDWDRLGVVFTRCLAYEEAHQAFRQALAAEPDVAAYHYNLATVLKSLGRIEQAQDALQSCLALDPCHWPAHYSLAHLGQAQQSRDHIQQLEQVLPKALGNPGAEMPARIALSREYEAIGNYPRAFE